MKVKKSSIKLVNYENQGKLQNSTKAAVASIYFGSGKAGYISIIELEDGSKKVVYTTQS